MNKRDIESILREIGKLAASKRRTSVRSRRPAPLTAADERRLDELVSRLSLWGITTCGYTSYVRTAYTSFLQNMIKQVVLHHPRDAAKRLHAPVHLLCGDRIKGNAFGLLA